MTMSSEAKYISQDPETATCGAFALAYYMWENYGHEADPDTDRKIVQLIYADIKFDNNDYSSPKKMIAYLTQNGNTADLRANENLKERRELYNELIDGCAVDFRSGDFINDLENGQYAIIICRTAKESHVLHYILVRKEENGYFTVIDPNNGIKQNDQTIKAGECVGNSRWIYLGAALVIEKIK